MVWARKKERTRTGCQLKCCIATSKAKRTEADNQKTRTVNINEDPKARNVDIYSRGDSGHREVGMDRQPRRQNT